MNKPAPASGARWLAWKVFLTCWMCYCALWTPYIVREHFPAITLSEHGTLNVEAYRGWSDDIFEGPRGGAYINNNPGASLTGAVPLLLLRPLLRRVDRWNQGLPRPVADSSEGDLFLRTLRAGRSFYFLLVAFLTDALVMAVATAGTAAYLCSRLIAVSVPRASSAICGLLYGLGTPVLFRAGHLNHNLLAGDAGFTALLLLWDPRNRRLSLVRSTIAGLLAGYAVLCDYSGVVIIAITGLYVWLRSEQQSTLGRFRLLGGWLAGLIPPLVVLALYQQWAFGSLYRPSQHYMVPTSPTSRGYRGFDWPSPALLWANFFDPRFGLFAFCPFLMLAFYAPMQKGVRYRVPDREMRVLFIYFLLFVLFCAANQYSWLQPSTGFRYLVPVVPALALLSMQVSQAFPTLIRSLLAFATCAQSLLMALAHENDVRRALPAVWERRFEPQWIIHLAKAGAPVQWWWTPCLFTLLAALLALLWLSPGRTRSKLSQAHE